jgi:hypothetical protein
MIWTPYNGETSLKDYYLAGIKTKGAEGLLVVFLQKCGVLWQV